MKQIVNFTNPQLVENELNPAGINLPPVFEQQNESIDELEKRLQDEEQMRSMANQDSLSQEDELSQTEDPNVNLKSRFARYQELKNRNNNDGFDERNKDQSLALLLKASQQIGQGMANKYAPQYKADTSIADTLYKQADQNVDDISKKQKIQTDQFELNNLGDMNDPTSPFSTMAQQSMLSLNPNLDPEMLKNTSGAQLLKLFPQLRIGLNAELRAEALKIARDSLDVRKDQGQKRIEVSKEQLGVNKGKLGLAKETQDWRKEEKDELSDKQTETIATVDSTLLDLNDAKKFKINANTGRIEAGSDYVKKLLGNQDPTMVNLKQALGNALADRKREITGTAASDAEAKFIESITVPDISMNDDVFMSTLDNAIRRVERYRKLKLDGFKKQGKNPVAFEKPFGSEEKEQTNTSEVIRRDPKTGKNAVFNSATKEFIRWEK